MKKLLGILILSTLLCCMKSNATSYYFSTTDGDDSRTSAQAQNQATPWKSIDKLNSFFSSLQGGDQILFKRGDTFYGSITISKSGPITLGAYGSGAKPVITGFSSISSWTSVGNGLYEAVVPAGLSTLNVVTLDGVFQVMGKMPKGNTGYYTASAGGTSSVSSSGISGIPNFTGGEIVWRPYHWTLWRGTVTSQTSSSVNFTAFPSTSGGGTEAAQANYGFFFQNSPAACTALGEWAYNSSSHKITMFFGGSGPGSHVVKVSSLQNIITNGGFSSITFDNLNIQGGNTYLISLSGSSNNTVNACDLFGGGVYGIFANGNSPNFAFTNSTMDRVNSNGIIYSSGSTASTITGNTFSNIGAVAGMGGSGEGQYFGIIDVKNGSNVSLNKLTNTGYIPICFQGTNNTIQNNYIDTFCTVKDDGAGIYCGGQSDAGTKVVSNIVFNSIGAPNGTPDKDSRAHGIYVDDGGSNVEIANNTVAYSSGAGIYDHNGHELNIHGNTSFDNRTTGIKYYNDGNSIANITITNNIFFAKTASEYVLQSSGGSASPVGFFTSADNNFWCRPMNENSAFSTLVPSGSYNLASWKSFTGKEASSKATPMTVTDASKIRFEYNAGSSSKVVNLGATYMDVKGVSYPGTITLAPYSSAVLLYVSGTVANQPPKAIAGADQPITLPANSVTLKGSGTDADGTIAAYQWSKVSGPSQFTIASPAQAQTTVDGLVQGVYQFELKVTDNLGAAGKDTLSVTVNAAADKLPVAKAGGTQVIVLPISIVILDGSGSSDPDGTITAYNWSMLSGPSPAIILTPTLPVTTITTLEQGVYQFELRVTDDKGSVGKDTVTVRVNAISNQSPVAHAGPDTSTASPVDSILLNGSGSDTDGKIASYLWTKIAGPTSVIQNPNQAQTVITGLVPGEYRFELEVKDDQNAVGKDTLVVTIGGPPGSGKFIKVNVYGGINPYANNEWNNWNVVDSTTSSSFNYSDGTASSVSAILSNRKRIIDNSSGYGGIVAPPEVLRYGSYSHRNRTLTINGLSPGVSYNLELYASENQYPDIINIFTVGQFSDTVSPYNNLANKAAFTDLKSSDQGQLLININSPDNYTNNYLNGFILREVDSIDTASRAVHSGDNRSETSGVNKLPAVSTLTIFPNPVTDNFNMQVNNENTGKMIVQILSQAGTAVRSYIFNKDQQVYQVSLSAMNLAGGIYFVHVQIGNWSDTKKILKL